jgi:HlyD family secretion protein
MSIEAKEGTRVAKGQPLIRLEDRRAKAQLTKAEIAVGEAKTRFIVAQKAQRLHDLTKRQQEWAISSARTAKAAAERNLASVRELAMTETLPESRLKDAQDRCDSLASALQVEELKLERLNLQDPTTEVAIAQSAVDAALADVECARQHLADHTMKAPTDGTVLRVLVNEGQFIGLNPLQAAIWFAPHQPTIIRAEVDQAFSSQLAVGMSAEFFDDNRRLSLGRGRIARISSWIAQRRSQLDEPFQRNDVRTLECIVEIDHATHELRLGERVRVDFFPAGTMTPDTPTVERLARNR